jgi:hypothetical protein
MAVENVFREKTMSITSTSIWMYNTARNCTERRVDRADLLVLEICSELMLPLASLTQCFARSVPEYPSADPNLRQLQPWLYFQRHGSPGTSFPPPWDATAATATTLSRLCSCPTSAEFGSRIEGM